MFVPTAVAATEAPTTAVSVGFGNVDWDEDSGESRRPNERNIWISQVVPAKSERAWCEGAAEGSDGRSASTASGLPGSPHRGSVVGGLPTQSRHIAANLRRGRRVHGRASHAALQDGTRSGRHAAAGRTFIGFTVRSRAGSSVNAKSVHA